ncbi:hypothetical protein [Yoonia sp. 2307UL14-13]|uniref:hypothetical protein n=1 Tax=Yoonia sp. 2307UL14-13 TaxID=3126506 RepID=UPI00309DBC30
MTKFIPLAAIVVTCVLGSAAIADGDQPAPAYINDMPYPAEVPVYTPRVVFDDMPFLAVGPVFGDMPYPAQMEAYTPMRIFADLPAPSYGAQPVDHAALDIDG